MSSFGVFWFSIEECLNDVQYCRAAMIHRLADGKKMSCQLF